MEAALGTLKKIDDLRTIWPNEAKDFTPWLAKNLSLLSDAVGIDISFAETESSVGDFSADILATDADTGRNIIIENQLGDTDHDHLGKLITYASGKSADIVIWIVKHAREEHRAAIEWLNNNTPQEIGFFLCEVKLYQIGDSPIAPYFELIEIPNNWSKGMKKASVMTRKGLPKIKDMLGWGVVKAGDIICMWNREEEEATLQANGHVSYNGKEYTLASWLKMLTGWSSIETYRYAIHKEKKESLGKIRKDYMVKMGMWDVKDE